MKVLPDVIEYYNDPAEALAVVMAAVKKRCEGKRFEPLSKSMWCTPKFTPYKIIAECAETVRCSWLKGMLKHWQVERRLMPRGLAGGPNIDQYGPLCLGVFYTLFGPASTTSTLRVKLWDFSTHVHSALELKKARRDLAQRILRMAVRRYVLNHAYLALGKDYCLFWIMGDRIIAVRLPNCWPADSPAIPVLTKLTKKQLAK